MDLHMISNNNENNLNSLRLRLANYSDVRMVLNWRNEPDTIMNMKTKRSLSFKEHDSWYKKAISDPECLFLIIEINDEPIGQLRYNKEDNMAKVSINITSKWHGKGVGSKAYKQGSEFVKKQGFSNIIFSRVLTTNIAAIKGMEKAGYKIIKRIIYEGEAHYYMKHYLKEI